MTPEASPDDHELLARLGRIARTVDPVPPLVYEMARAALAFGNIDGELAALVNDSTQEMAPVRGPVLDARLLEFSSRDLDIDLQVSAENGRRSLIGQVHSVLPGGVASLVVEASSGERSSPTLVDADGRFAFDVVPSGSIRLRCEHPDGSSVVTPWIAFPHGMA